MLLQDYLTYWSAAVPDKVCVFDDRRSYTYREIDEWSDRIAMVLTELGVRDGERFGVLAHNCPDFIAIYFGAFKSGAVPVPLNFRLHPNEWRFLLEDSGSGVVLAQSTFAEGLGSLLKAMHKGTEHIGKLPERAQRTMALSQRMRALNENLQKAVAAENYETAASLRDQIKQLETDLSNSA